MKKVVESGKNFSNGDDLKKEKSKTPDPLLLYLKQISKKLLFYNFHIH